MSFTEPPVQDLYNERFRSWGRSVRTVGWSTSESQERRFERLFAGLSVAGARVVDIGCGLGDLVPWLTARHGDDFRYLGLDVADELVHDARRRYASEHVSFHVADCRGIEIPPCDIAVASGAFSYRPAWTVEQGLHMLGRMNRAASICAASNFLTDRVDFVEPRNLHYSPEVVLGHALSLTETVNMFTGYGLFEFTIQLFGSTKEART